MLNRIRKMREKKGFTLVELIVVIAIIAILTAVIVPLVGRYSAQATYSTLQDSAKTISNTTNTVISDVTMMGTVISSATITGSKASGTLTLTGVTGDFQTKLTTALQNAVPNDSKFEITVAGNTVTGVIYATDNTADFTETIEADTDFNEAYRTATGKVAVGVAGNKIP